MQAVFDLITASGPFRSVEEANRVLASRMREYNARPQAELGGLSPDAMQQLLYGDWKSQGALRVDERIALDDLYPSALLADARTLLEYFQSEGPVKETAAHNLPRVAVAALLPRLRMSTDAHIVHNTILTTSSNEGDVPWLPELRHVLIFGKLLARRKGMRITPLGRALLSAERAGELYAHLFRTFFRELDLGVFGGIDRHRGLQSTLAYSFYMLRSAARDWTSPQILAQSAWLESAKDPLAMRDAGHADLRYISFQLRVLDPLVQFGLLELRPLPSENPWRDDLEYRCAPLFGRVLHFDFRRG